MAQNSFVTVATSIFIKHSILNLWEGSPYMSGFKVFGVLLSIPGISIWQGSEFPGLRRVYLFSQIWQRSEYVSDAIMKGFLTFQDSKYAKFLYMQGLNKVLNIFEYRRIIALLSCHIRGWSESTFLSCLNVKELLGQNSCNVSATVNWLQPALNPQPLTLQMNSKTFS